MLRFAPLAAALGLALLAGPAAAQYRYDDGYGRRSYEHDWRSGAWRGDPRYGDDYGVDTGIRDIAICPAGYHLGRSGRLCWPD